MPAGTCLRTSTEGGRSSLNVSEHVLDDGGTSDHDTYSTLVVVNGNVISCVCIMSKEQRVGKGLSRQLFFKCKDCLPSLIS